MALVVGTNTFVTLAEANTYFSSRFGAIATWAGLTDAIKEALLITAYNWILSDPNYVIAAVTDKIKQAQMELAWYTYNYLNSHEKREALIAQGVKRFSLSKWSETLSMVDLPKKVKDLLSDANLNEGGYVAEFQRDLEQ